MKDDAESTGQFARRAAMGVAGMAVAVTLVHLGQGIGLILALGMPALTGFAAWSIAMELAVMLGIGVLLAPLYKLPRGEWVFPVGMTLAVIVTERIVAVDPSKLQMWVLPALVSLVVFAIGRALWRVRPPLVVALAAVLPVVLLTLPLIADALREEEGVSIAKGKAPEGAPDVLMIVMDTVRSQSCGTFGYERDTTPVLDQLAAEGVAFDDAYAPSTWSLPAHAALFTGAFPSKNNANCETRYLDGHMPTLAEFMVKEGWESHAFSANPHISDSFGLTRGFQHNDKAWMAGTSGRNFSYIYRIVDALGLGAVNDKGGAVVVGNIQRWMASRPADDGPAFVFVNFLEAHFPFRQLPEEFRNAYQSADMNTLREIDQIAFGVQFGRQLTPEETKFVHQPLIDLYDGGVKYTDHLVGEVIDVWRKAGRLDDTVVMVLADHGEMVGEHGSFGHVTPVAEEIFRVPLVIRYPKKIPAGTRVPYPVSTAGVFDTLAELAGFEPSPMSQVGSLLATFGDPPDPGAGYPILAERFEEEMLAARFAPGTANGSGPLVIPHGRYRVFRDGPYKLVQHVDHAPHEGPPTVVLYNLESDPGETRDLAAAEPDTVDALAQKLEGYRESLGLPELDAPIVLGEQREMSDAEREALCKLGYLSDC